MYVICVSLLELEGDELVRKEDGSYLKTLQLDPLSENDAGLYLCLGNNRYGYTIEKTYLNVKPSKSIITTYVVFELIAFYLFLFFVFVFRLQKKTKRL